ncbi:hypothetical protein ACOSQ4_004699 [Xanthoceras sorbifolium]
MSSLAKKRNGLLNKAYELLKCKLLFECFISNMSFSNRGKLYEFCSGISKTLERYQCCCFNPQDNSIEPSVGEVANLLQRSRKEASVVEVEAEAEDEVEAVVMDEVGILTAATSTTTRKEKAQQEAVEEAIQTRGTINLKEEPSLTIEVRVSSSSAIPLIRKVTSYTTRTIKSL